MVSGGLRIRDHWTKHKALWGAAGTPGERIQVIIFLPYLSLFSLLNTVLSRSLPSCQPHFLLLFLVPSFSSGSFPSVTNSSTTSWLIHHVFLFTFLTAFPQQPLNHHFQSIPATLRCIHAPCHYLAFYKKAKYIPITLEVHSTRRRDGMAH